MKLINRLFWIRLLGRIMFNLNNFIVKILIILKSVQDIKINTILNNNKFMSIHHQQHNMSKNQSNNINKDTLLLDKIHNLWKTLILKWHQYKIINKILNLHHNKMLECSLLVKMENLLRKDNSILLINLLLSFLLNLLFIGIIYNLLFIKIIPRYNPSINWTHLWDRETVQLCILLLLLKILNNKSLLPLVIDIKYSSLLLHKEWSENHSQYLNKKPFDFHDLLIIFHSFKCCFYISIRSIIFN